eukprot:385183_1
MSEKFVFGDTDGMEIEENEQNEDTFVNDSEDTNEEQIKQSTKTEKFDQSRYDGKSNTIRISPILRGFTESHIYDFIFSLTNKKPLSIKISLPKNYPQNRISKDRTNPLFDACNAYVIFESNDDASFVANKLNKTSIPNIKHITSENIECSCAVTSICKHNDVDLRNNSNWIKVTNLSKDINEQNILTHIQNNSGIKNKPNNIFLCHHSDNNNNNNNNNNNSYAIIECVNNEDATKCVENLRLTTLGKNNNKIWCTWRPIRKEFNRKENELEGKTKQLLLGNLHYTLKQNDVSQLCSKYGQVNSIDMWYDKYGYSTGCATIIMDNFDDAKKLFQGLNGEKIKNLKIITAYTKTQKKKKTPKVMTKRGKKGNRGGKG